MDRIGATLGRHGRGGPSASAPARRRGHTQPARRRPPLPRRHTTSAPCPMGDNELALVPAPPPRAAGALVPAAPGLALTAEEAEKRLADVR